MATCKDIPNVVPPGVDMLDVIKADGGNSLKEVLHLKQQANEKVKDGDYFGAKCLYSASLELLERCCLHLKDADETWIGIKNNMALCDLKRSEWTRVIEFTTEVLQRNPSNAKALYRRGVAFTGQDKYSEAHRDLKAVVDMDPKNVEARQKLAEVIRLMKQNRTDEKEQAEKMRGFLSGERLHDTVAITEDGGVRKLHSNENAPLLGPWVKRQFLAPGSGAVAVVTAHVVIKTQAGVELLTTRLPPTSKGQGKGGQVPRVVAEPGRWVLEDAWGGTFKAWNAAVKSLRVNELGHFEIDRRTLGPSVEDAVLRCTERWFAGNVELQEAMQELPEEKRAATLRHRALQLLGLPEVFCMEPFADADQTLSMEMELLEVAEFLDVKGDGTQLVRMIRDGEGDSEQGQRVTDLSTVSAHFRIARLLSNYGMKDTRMGLVKTIDGMVMSKDKTKEPMTFIIGEEEASGEGDFVPPCVGRCLLVPPGGAAKGSKLEIVLRGGVPISDMDKNMHTAMLDGQMGGFPDTTGPVVITVEVDQVVPSQRGPSSPEWQGLTSIARERKRAEELEEMEGGRFKKKALRRWWRILSWLAEVLKTKSTVDENLYDMDWGDGGEASGPPAEASEASGAPAAAFEVPPDLLRQLHPDELCEWARAHASASALLGGEGDEEKGLSRRHALAAVGASEAGEVDKEVEVKARLMLAEKMTSAGEAGAALEVLKRARALDPTNPSLKDQSAVATQKDTESVEASMKESLGRIKQCLASALDATDSSGLVTALKELDALPLTWEAVSGAAVGKEVGRCTKLEDPTVADPAKALVARFHKLAKEQRPMWVR